MGCKCPQWNVAFGTVAHSDIASCMDARSPYVSEILKINNWEDGKWNRQIAWVHWE